MRHINEKGLGIIKHYEKCVLTAYPDPGTGGDPWTCGWGQTGKDICKGTVWTQATADKRLQEHLELTEQCVSRCVEVKLTDNEFSALVSWAFNCGCAALRSSTLLRFLNEERRQEAADQFLRWDKAGGRTLKGLTTRRAAERQLFLTP